MSERERRQTEHMQVLKQYSVQADDFTRELAALNGHPYLLIDDDQGMNALVRDMFEETGNRVECLQSVEEAIELLEVRGLSYYATILLDVRFPIRSLQGLDFLRWVREQGNGVPVIVWTADPIGVSHELADEFPFVLITDKDDGLSALRRHLKLGGA